MRNNWIRQFTAPPFLHMAPAINKLNGCGLSNTARRERLPKKTKVTQYWQQKDYQAVPTRRSVSMIEVSGRMRSDAFKTGLGFRFTNNFDLQQLYTNNKTRELV